MTVFFPWAVPTAHENKFASLNSKRLQELLLPPLHREWLQAVLLVLPERELETREAVEVPTPLQSRPPLWLVVRKDPSVQRPSELPEEPPPPFLKQLFERQFVESLLQSRLRDLEHARSHRKSVLSPQPAELASVHVQTQEPEVLRRVWPLPRRPRMRSLLPQLEREPQKGLETRPPKEHLEAQAEQSLDTPFLPQ